MRQSEGKTRRLCMAMLVAAMALPAQVASVPTVADEIERLRALLSQPGPDGRDAREAGVGGLLALPQLEAHRVLHQFLLRRLDPDQLRQTILDALQLHLLGNASTQFGGAVGEVRRGIAAGYLGALAPFWSPALDEASAALRPLARQSLQRLPVRELEAAARPLLGSAELPGRCELLLCLADMQQTLLAPLLAEYLAAEDPVLRTTATKALQLLVYPDLPLRTPADFAAWQQAFGSLRYLDLVERAARARGRSVDDVEGELLQIRVDAARDVVRALVQRSNGIDWTAVQTRTVVDQPAILIACLEQLQQSLALTLPGDEAPAARQGFAKALLQRFHALDAAEQRSRSLLLEVAAYLTRAEEAELAGELTSLLQQQLDSPDADAKVSALRALRRFPGPAARARLVHLATTLVDDAPAHKQQLGAILATLAARTAPRWSAPSPADADRAEWLALIARCCRTDPQLELREPALALAQTLDARDQRVPDVFGLLLDLVRDQRADTKFRSTCLIHLQGFRNDQALAEDWVKALHGVLADPEPQLRQRAAESLAQLTESVDVRRADWLASTILALRDRIEVESDAAVLRSLVDCLQACGRQPQMTEKAIGALKKVVGDIAVPAPPEQQFRLEPLLQALATIAADPRADRGQWTAACAPLLLHRKRQSLRLVLRSQAAAELAKDVRAADEALAKPAALAMKLLILTALLKPMRESFASSEELQQEARDVRIAFGALDGVVLDDFPDNGDKRVLRLEVELVGQKHQDVVQRAQGWLASAGMLDDEQRARVRWLAAEAQLALGRADAAKKLLDDRGAERDGDFGFADLLSRVGRALEAADPGGSVALFDRALAATAPDDAALRSRVMEWLRTALRQQPAARAEVLTRAETFAPLFSAADCPPDLREQFQQLRASR
jgi:hypothetical protein